MEQEPSTPINPELIKLQEWERACKQALEEANKPVTEGGATPAVIEELRTQYFLAKQAREDFEKDHQ